MRHKRYPRYTPSGVDWLGELPAHWDIGKFSREIRVAEGQVDPQIEPYASMLLIAPNHIEAGTGRLLSTETAGEQGAESGKYLCRHGDVIYSKIRPALAKVTLAPVDCLCSADMYPLRGINRVEDRYACWLLLSRQFTAWSVLESDRVAMPKINRETLSSLRLPVPPSVEQRAIADFLDTRTAKLDALMAKNRALIELLKEKRSALISRTVTRGLPPDAARASGIDPHPRLMSSGTEYVGDMPEHWSVSPLGFLARFHGGATPDKARSEYWDGPIPWVSPKDMKQPRLSDAEDHVSDEALRDSPLSLIPVGAVLVVVRGMILAHSFPVALTEAPLTINQDMKALLPGESVEPRFLAWTLTGLARVIVAQADESAHGTRKIETAILAKLPLAVPPLAEQQAIAAYLDRETAKIDRLIAKIESAIDRLQEYRSALITAAVTGKIDVRETAA